MKKLALKELERILTRMPNSDTGGPPEFYNNIQEANLEHMIEDA
jgi:hypothetical protein